MGLSGVEQKRQLCFRLGLDRSQSISILNPRFRIPWARSQVSNTCQIGTINLPLRSDHFVLCEGGDGWGG